MLMACVLLRIKKFELLTVSVIPWILPKDYKARQRVMAQACNASTQEAEAGGL